MKDIRLNIICNKTGEILESVHHPSDIKLIPHTDNALRVIYQERATLKGYIVRYNDEVFNKAIDVIKRLRYSLINNKTPLCVVNDHGGQSYDNTNHAAKVLKLPNPSYVLMVARGLQKRYHGYAIWPSDRETAKRLSRLTDILTIFKLQSYYANNINTTRSEIIRLT